MGAIERPDLTADVTHLLVGATDSPKYKFVARERNDVTVLRPEWIEAVRQSWMQGGDTDIQALVKQYELPTFFGLTICITGFSDMAFRTQMHDMTVENGAEFRKDLTKSVTHLVSRSTEGEKYKFATQWNIKVVTVKWFHDCIERGMILDEDKYHPRLPLEEQGLGAWDRTIPMNAKLQLGRARPAASDSSSNPRPRKKLRRTASTKLIGQNENIWGDIIGAGFANEVAESRNARSEGPVTERPKPFIQAAKSFKGVLRHHLEFNAAHCVDSLTEFSSPSIPKTGQGLFVMVPYKTPRSEVPSTDDMAFECEVVTDMWLERCLDARALVPPESHVASTPFPKFPIPGFSGMRICSTGFARIDLLHLSKLVDLMGASYDEYLTSKASVLICNDPQTASHDKLRHTSEWGVPAVSADWFWISVQTGQKKPFDPYIVRRPVSQKNDSREKPSETSVSGKAMHPPTGKAREGLSKTSKGPATGRQSKTVVLEKSDKSRTLPIVGDGFTDEEPADVPQASVAESRSPSPDRNTNASPADEAPKPAAPSALDSALKGLLQQAQAAKSRRQSESMTTDDSSYPQPRKRKPLLGRAPSHSSNRATELNRAPSRASSIDTLNDDGLGSALESAELTRENSFSRTNSRNDQSLSSMFSGAKFDFLTDRLPGQIDNEDEENQEPQMTQLDYEDPDATAMRAEFLRNAGKLAGNPKKADSDVLLGEVRELEDIGWGHGRRTRKQVPKPDGE
ncbi:S-M checkpoint control protein rad4 [Penicillium subrubescens]|uniref:S-M checkpoint control protein rad4 n=1 Tax=Penicillium subrubescens TaxID=1316194 RepID=A0A1Q5UPN2_9EURO|nr:S-M checkpoint control protein rad4 [Penicillium subrubescens]